MKVILDSGVLIRALASIHPDSEATLNKIVNPCKHNILVSKKIFNEMQGIAYQDFGIPARQILRKIDELDANKKLRKVKLSGMKVPFKINDTHLLDLAVSGHADFIITLDTEDLVNQRGSIESWARRQHCNLRVVDPSEFLISQNPP